MSSAAIPPFAPHQAFPPQAPQHAKNGFGIASLVLGIIGVVTGFIPFVGIVTAILLGAIGLLLGILGFLRARKHVATNGGMAIAGSILSGIAIIIGLISLLLGVALIGAASDASNEPVAQATLDAGAQQAGATADADAKATDATTTATSQFPGQMEKDVVGKAGDELTVNGVAVTASALTERRNVFQESMQCTDVTVKNTSDHTISSLGTYDFKVQNPAGAATDAAYSGLDNELPTADLAPGGTAQGVVCFDVEQTAPGQNVVIYSELLDFDATRGAWINQLG